MGQSFWLKVKVTLGDQNSVQMFSLLRKCAKEMSQSFRANVTIKGQLFKPAYFLSHSLKGFNLIWLQCFAY